MIVHILRRHLLVLHCLLVFNRSLLLDGILTAVTVRILAVVIVIVAGPTLCKHLRHAADEGKPHGSRHRNHARRVRIDGLEEYGCDDDEGVLGESNDLAQGRECERERPLLCVLQIELSLVRILGELADKRTERDDLQQQREPSCRRALHRTHRRAPFEWRLDVAAAELCFDELSGTHGERIPLFGTAATPPAHRHDVEQRPQLQGRRDEDAEEGASGHQCAMEGPAEGADPKEEEGDGDEEEEELGVDCRDLALDVLHTLVTRERIADARAALVVLLDAKILDELVEGGAH